MSSYPKLYKSQSEDDMTPSPPRLKRKRLPEVVESQGEEHQEVEKSKDDVPEHTAPPKNVSGNAKGKGKGKERAMRPGKRRPAKLHIQRATEVADERAQFMQGNSGLSPRKALPAQDFMTTDDDASSGDEGYATLPASREWVAHLLQIFNRAGEARNITIQIRLDEMLEAIAHISRAVQELQRLYELDTYTQMTGKS